MEGKEFVFLVKQDGYIITPISLGPDIITVYPDKMVLSE